MRMMLEAMEEGSLDASIHGGAMGAWSSIYFGDHFGLEEGTIGGGCTLRRNDLDFRDCIFFGLSGEVAHKSTFWCKGFFFGATKVKGASLE
jgi:hypothetical protein